MCVVGARFFLVFAKTFPFPENVFLVTLVTTAPSCIVCTTSVPHPPRFLNVGDVSNADAGSSTTVSKFANSTIPFDQRCWDRCFIPGPRSREPGTSTSLFPIRRMPIGMKPKQSKPSVHPPVGTETIASFPTGSSPQRSMPAALRRRFDQPSRTRSRSPSKR